MVRLITASPFGLDYLCKVGGGHFAFLKGVIAPLSWFGFGSVVDLLELPVTMLNRLVMMMEEEGMVERYWSYKDPYIKSRGR